MRDADDNVRPRAIDRPADDGATDSPSRILNRRRALLTELFFLCKYADVVQEYDGEDGAARAQVDAEDLKGFLEQNDLELGRTFDQSTLPDLRLEAVQDVELLKSGETTAGQSAEEQQEAERLANDDAAHAVQVKLTQGTAGSGVLVDDEISNSDSEIAQASLLKDDSVGDVRQDAHSPQAKADEDMPDVDAVPPSNAVAEADSSKSPPPAVEIVVADAKPAEVSIRAPIKAEHTELSAPRAASERAPTSREVLQSEAQATPARPRAPPLRSNLSTIRQAIVETESEYTLRSIDLHAWQQDALAFPLHDVLEGANKVVSTTDWAVAIQEKRYADAIERIEQMKKQGKWSLRQPERAPCVKRRKCHRDYMLEEMKWMRTDFREERKWKVATAQKLALACQQWHLVADKAEVCIAARPIRHLASSQTDLGDVSMEDVSAEYHPPTPPDARVAELGHVGGYKRRASTSEDAVSAQDLIEARSQIQSPPLSTIDDSAYVFQLGSDEVCAYLPDSGAGPAGQGLLLDLPIYTPPVARDEQWTDPYESLPLISTSLYATSPIEIRPNKKARLAISEHGADSAPDGETDASSSLRRRAPHLGLQMRPPLPPHNIDARQKATWTPELDEHLLAVLSEYGYNWDLVAQALTPANILYPVSERKTAWDCFERWIQIDPRANDVVFTGAHARLVQTKVDDMVKAPRADRNAPRRVYTMPKSHQFYSPKARHFAMFDVMRKVQRKRENNLNNNNKPNVLPKKAVQQDQSKAPPQVPTPAQLAHLKYERDQQIARAFHETKNQQLLAMQQAQQQAVAVAAAQRQANQASQAGASTGATSQAAAQASAGTTATQAQHAQAPANGSQLTPQQQQQQQQQQILQAQVQAQAQAMQQAALAARQGGAQGSPLQAGKAPTAAQIAIIRQAQAQRAQLAQQQAVQAAQAAQAAGLPHGANASPRPVAQAAQANGRPSLVGQMPPRPAASALINGIPAHQLAASLRLPPGTRLTQEQMQTLIQQARQAKGLAGAPVQVNGGMVLPNGVQQMLPQHLQAQAVQRFQAAQAKSAANAQLAAQHAQQQARAGTPMQTAMPQQQQLQRQGTPGGVSNGHVQNGTPVPAQPSPLSAAGTPIQRASSSPHPGPPAKIEKAR